MRCQARVEDTLYTFPNTKVTYHTTKQCEEIGVHKYSVDEGDSEMVMCGGCLRRCLSKKNSNSSWLGFFDCSYPPEAKVKGSAWYHSTLVNCPPPAEENDTTNLSEQMANCCLYEEADPEPDAEEAQEEVQPEVQEEEVEAEEPPEPSPAEVIKTRIAHLQAFVRTSHKMPLKEQAKILKEIIDLRTQLKKL
jgi:hypothetical protein